MSEHSLLGDLIVTYALALLFIIALARLRVPAIVAMIMAGAAAGPAGFGVVSTQEEVNTLAEIGIVLLLFAVGLDFSLTEIRRIWTTIVGGGVLQMGGTAAAVLLVATRAGTTWRIGLFIGLFVALSSTAIVLRELSSRNQIDAPHGRLAVGILLFQDLSIVAVLLLVPILSGKTPLTAIPAALLRALLAIGAVAVVSRLVLPAFLGLVARSGRREAFPLAVLLASIGTAWASSLLGVSMALGAFLGGLVLAESEFSHQAHAEIRPLRDVLAGLFFISLGMLVDLAAVARQLPLIGAIALAIVLLKTVIAAGAFVAVATPLRVAVTAAIGLAQIGEFSFILGRSGLDVGLLTPDQWQLLLAASIATMVVTPTLVGFAPQAGSWAARRTRKVAPAGAAEIPALSDHVVVLGFGVGGQLLARTFRDLAIPYVILDLNGSTVRQARRDGEPIYYGDATGPDALISAGVQRAKAVIAVLSDPRASIHVVSAVRAVAPDVPLIVRARYRSEAEDLLRQGATVAVAEELEASLEVLAQALEGLDIPGNVADVLLAKFRQETTGVRPLRAPGRMMDALPAEISRRPVATHQIQTGDWAAGLTLGELNLRADTGALVIAVQRGTEYVTSPAAELRLQAGDVLYLFGDVSDVLLARQRLTVGNQPVS
jgi:CPA2 family monovalent cation:H+ antiporter-2